MCDIFIQTVPSNADVPGENEDPPHQFRSSGNGGEGEDSISLLRAQSLVMGLNLNCYLDILGPFMTSLSLYLNEPTLKLIVRW